MKTRPLHINYLGISEMRKILTALCFTSALWACVASAGTNPSAPLATNLNAVSDFSDEFPFVDLMKSSRDWIPGNASGCFDCRTPGSNAACLAPNACPVTINR